MRPNGVKAIESVPSLENVTVRFGMVIDEQFSSLVMRAEFYEEVKSIEIVNSLASEARLFCTLANLNANLKNRCERIELKGKIIIYIGMGVNFINLHGTRFRNVRIKMLDGAAAFKGVSYQQQLALDEEALRETLEEEAMDEKERERAKKEWEKEMKKDQAHDELFRLEFGVNSDSEYESD
ncbi:hypothetical protein Tco_0225964 [Tanacetum coccineum]